MSSAASNTVVETFNELVDRIDDLLQHISDIDTPEINKIRTKLQVARTAARSAWGDTAHYANRQVTDSLRWAEDYLRLSPWWSVAVAMAAGIAMGTLFTRQSGNGNGSP
jgi:ElaB/YqjD/DUF883 family membrane-anchored ribosome-binding protein